MSEQPLDPQRSGIDGPHFTVEGDTAGLAPWTEIEEGRFMPRRVRGSCLGRALG
ncbi:MAG: hypothetical protein IT428_24105 [Planctomycetaceae bacterium]|nr:hypothetical protein [Planctomycetaceae bacterium]